MPSPEALYFETYYHIYNRGSNRENIFLEDRNYMHFFRLYLKYIEPIADTYAYCLLRNHFHLLIRTKAVKEIRKTLKVPKNFKISTSFSNFFNAYAKSINQAYGRVGSLFQHPFGRAPLSESNPFERVVIYIHQNPQKHGFVERFSDWKYSSYHSLLANGPTHLDREEVFSRFGGRELFIQSHLVLSNEENPDHLDDPRFWETRP
jgi:putative transposase